ncbi:hypothetical protein [Parendozoicomonas haliclonae]|uniref:Uncharacterized protein n=1 Tax=Parendozoicomonas haliclonae TaxID=1960125 RepID=A0A1X7ARH1_9GAMM|nr:hypothetical protein [Parendozoicomonas haliclonae]SMA50688.1 hypothetical protein EHSB41UT_04505 [Parendozoicomonas haliclonae]
MNIPWGPFDPQDHPRPSSQGEFFKMMQEASLVEFGRYRNAFVQEYDVDPETHPMLGSVLTLPPDYPHSVLNGVTVYELRGLPDSVANNPELATFRATSSIYMLRGLKDKPEFLAIPLLTSRFMDKDRRLLIPEEMSIAVVDIENTANPVSFTKVQVESVVPAIQQPVNLKPARYQLVFVVEDKTVGQYMPKLDSAPVKEAALSQGASKDNLSAESGELQSLAKELDSLLSQAIARTETAKSEFVEPEASLPAKMLYPKTVVRKELVRKDVLNSAYLPVPYKARFQISPQTLKGFFIEPTFRVKIDSFPSHNADPVIYQLEGLPQCVISRHDLAGLTTTSPVYLLENFNGVGKTTINLEISSPRSARKRIAYINMDDASAPVIFNAELKKCTPHPSIKNKENIYTQTAVLPSVWYQLVFAVKSTTNTDSSSGVEGRECISHHRHETERMQARVTWKWDSSGSRDPVENMETGGVRS